jgi:hypothetical protein
MRRRIGVWNAGGSAPVKARTAEAVLAGFFHSFAFFRLPAHRFFGKNEGVFSWFVEGVFSWFVARGRG